MTIKQLGAVLVASIGLTGWSAAALADAAAGKATYEEICSECHEDGDFKGEDPKEVSASIKKIVAGQMKHKKKLTLTDQQIADVAAYMVTK